MAKGKQPHPLTKPINPKVSILILTILGAFAVIVLLIVLQVQYGIFTPKPNPSNQVIVHTYHNGSPPPTALPTSTPLPPKTFTSNVLGVSFQYPPEGVYVTETGNTIYVSPYKNNPKGAFSIEVYQKAASEPLTDAIKRQFLQGYSPDICQVQMADSSVDAGLRNAPRHPTYQYALITLTNAAREQYSTINERAKLCPYFYTYIGNGTEYFLADSSHPTKYLFVNIGQSGLPAGPELNYAWQATIQFLDTP